MAQVINLTEAKAVNGCKTIGNNKCSAWLVAPGVVWIQVRHAKLKQKLERIDGAKLVVRGVAGGYLRTFEFQKPLSWARNWIKRHAGTNSQFSKPECPTANDEVSIGWLGRTVPGLPISEIRVGKLGIAA